LRLIFAVVCVALLGSCSPNLPLLDQIRLLGELRVVTRNAPTTFYYGANERYGIEYELAKAFADHLGVRLNLRTVDQIDQIFPAIASGQSHIAAAGLTVTESRENLVAFSPSYQEVTPQLIYRMGAKRPRSMEDVAGSLLEIRAGSSHVELLYRALDKIPGLAWAENRSSGAETLMRRVAQGTIDYAVVNSNEFNLLRNYYPEVRVAFDLESQASLGWALPRHAYDLQEEVSAFFAEMEATGDLGRILDRYYVATRDFDFVGASAFVRHLNERFAGFRSAFQAAENETGIDWKILAAIAYQESHWNADAVSPTGVKGLMMLTANTANLVGISDRADPRDSILGGARYLARVLEKFPDRIPEEDRMLMAIAAYNIGFGHVEDARIITESRDGNKDSWEDVRENLPLLTDERWYPHLKRGYAPGSVPVQYVDNVRHYYWLLDRVTGTKIFSALAITPQDKTGDPI
jgi:membrane-bound lytic murein transglycosylase F